MMELLARTYTILQGGLKGSHYSSRMFVRALAHKKLTGHQETQVLLSSLRNHTSRVKLYVYNGTLDCQLCVYIYTVDQSYLHYLMRDNMQFIGKQLQMLRALIV